LNVFNIELVQIWETAMAVTGIVGWLVVAVVAIGLAAWGTRVRWARTALVAGVGLALATTALATLVVGNYGLTLFLELPLLIGFIVGKCVLTARPEARFGDIAGVIMLTFALTGTGFLLLGIEGVVCVFMAAPLVLPAALVGAWAALKLHRRQQLRTQAAVSLLALVLPLGLGVERWLPAHPDLLAVRTAVQVDAPPEVVWRHVVEFPPLPPPRDLLFRAGIAYPVRAQIAGRGVGSVRRCVFSTGAFVEPIVVWDQPRLLRFTVTANPPALQELSPYPIHPPHVRGFLLSRAGQFQLTPLAGGRRTLLIGTTWYQDALRPAAYWRLWSDMILHRIHHRVLDQIKQNAERDRARSPQSAATALSLPAFVEADAAKALQWARRDQTGGTPGWGFASIRRLSSGICFGRSVCEESPVCPPARRHLHASRGLPRLSPVAGQPPLPG
jgi:hypothetical protein